MPWVRFTRTFDWYPLKHRRYAREFRAGAVRNVPRACADEAERKQAAVRIERPRTRQEAREARRG